MQLHKAVDTVLVQLSDSIGLLSAEQYARSCRQLSGGSIGQHVRHIVEMFQCLENGYDSGVIDYEKRNRNRQIENDRDLARKQVRDIFPQLNKPDKPLWLMTCYDYREQDPERILSNYFREIAYNLEHSIHHMALIRVGMGELGDFQLEEAYGVAFSTVKYRTGCAR